MFGVPKQIMKSSYEASKNNAFMQKALYGRGGSVVDQLGVHNQSYKNARAGRKDVNSQISNIDNTMNNREIEMNNIKKAIDAGNLDPTALAAQKTQFDSLNALQLDDKAARKGLSNQIAGYDQATADAFVGYGKTAKDWMIGADYRGGGGGRAMAVGARAGLVGAGAVALGTGGRMLTGGTMTHNNQGERDIAGIPFI